MSTAHRPSLGRHCRRSCQPFLCSCHAIVEGGASATTLSTSGPITIPAAWTRARGMFCLPKREIRSRHHGFRRMTCGRRSVRALTLAFRGCSRRMALEIRWSHRVSGLEVKTTGVTNRIARGRAPPQRSFGSAAVAVACQRYVLEGLSEGGQACKAAGRHWIS